MTLPRNCSQGESRKCFFVCKPPHHLFHRFFGSKYLFVHIFHLFYVFTYNKFFLYNEFVVILDILMIQSVKLIHLTKKNFSRAICNAPSLFHNRSTIV